MRMGNKKREKKRQAADCSYGQRRENSNRKSTIAWLKAAFDADIAHSILLRDMEADAYKDYNKKEQITPTSPWSDAHHIEGEEVCDDGGEDPNLKQPPREDPINIMVFDGGGTKGYASVAITEEIERVAREELGQTDFVSHFDLLAGTSAGGIAALLLNQTASTKDAAIQARELTDRIVMQNFKNISPLRFLFTGNAVKEKQQIGNIVKDFFGDTRPLKNEKGLKAFVVTASKNTNNTKKKGGSRPFLLRTYESPKGPNVLPGTCDLDLDVAIHATTGIPGISDRVDLKYENEWISLADGGIVSNCPIALAIMEAQQLWPRRPMGVILSIGLDVSQDRFVYRAFDVARVLSPSCHLYRIIPEKALEGHGPVDRSMKKIAHLEFKSRSYLQTFPREKLLLRRTLELLFQSKSRRNDSDALRQASKSLTKEILVSTNNKKYQNLRNTIQLSAVRANVSSTIEDEEEELEEYLGITTSGATNTNHRKQKRFGMSIMGTGYGESQKYLGMSIMRHKQRMQSKKDLKVTFDSKTETFEFQTKISSEEESFSC